MSYTVRRFRLTDLDDLDVRPELAKDLDFIKKDEALKQLYTKIATCFSLKKDGITVAIYGCYNTGYGTYIPLLLASKDIDKHKFAMIRCFYAYVEKYVGKDVTRFEAYATINDTNALRLIDFLGFSIVGIRRCASVTGEDQVICERLYRK